MHKGLIPEEMVTVMVINIINSDPRTKTNGNEFGCYGIVPNASANPSE